MSKYKPLSDFLKNLDYSIIELTFDDINKILGTDLPNAAYRYPAWWANSRTDDSHTWAHLWIEAGWESRDLNLGQHKVKFERIEAYNR